MMMTMMLMMHRDDGAATATTANDGDGACWWWWWWCRFVLIVLLLPTASEVDDACGWWGCHGCLWWWRLFSILIPVHSNSSKMPGMSIKKRRLIKLSSCYATSHDHWGNIKHHNTCTCSFRIQYWHNTPSSSFNVFYIRRSYVEFSIFCSLSMCCLGENT